MEKGLVVEERDAESGEQPEEKGGGRKESEVVLATLCLSRR